MLGISDRWLRKLGNLHQQVQRTESACLLGGGLWVRTIVLRPRGRCVTVSGPFLDGGKGESDLLQGGISEPR